VEEVEMISWRHSFPVLVSVILLALPSFAAAENSQSATPLTTTEIVQKLMDANLRRSRALRGYQGMRTYHLTYTGIFGHHQAEMEVEVRYTAPDKKEFRVISKSGASLLINRVLMKMLSSESEAQQEQNRKQLEVNSQNYNFALERLQHTSEGDFYVLDVTPKGKSRYLYRGKIWVDAHDFAVARMEGEPQRNPSFWVNRTQVAYRWARQDGFWLPAHTESASQVRMGGKIDLTIDYSDYKINSGTNLANQHDPGSDATLPAPNAITGDPR
jgi:outer membrane lipoprotein-sorting protein